MCSTDYSADIVYGVFKEIVNCENIVALDDVKRVALSIEGKVVPLAPNNEMNKAETRNSFRIR